MPEREQLMRRASLFSLSVAGVLVALKMLAFSYTGAMSILSSLVDSALDVAASTINFIAVRYALQPPDKEHRFGHGKAEDLATLAQSAFIFGSGLFLIFESGKRLLHPAPVQNGMIGVAVMIVSIVLTMALVLYQRHVVKKTASNVIKADSFHYFIDFLTNAGVIISLIASSVFQWTWLDPLIALAIAFYIIYGAYELSHGAFHNLMDHEFSEDERSTIKQLVSGCDGVLGLHHLKTRKSGINSFIQFHLDLDENISLKHAHEISHCVEEKLLEAFPHAEILIHQDPQHSEEHTPLSYT